MTLVFNEIVGHVTVLLIQVISIRRWSAFLLDEYYDKGALNQSRFTDARTSGSDNKEISVCSGAVCLFLTVDPILRRPRYFGLFVGMEKSKEINCSFCSGTQKEFSMIANPL